MKVEGTQGRESSTSEKSESNSPLALWERDRVRAFAHGNIRLVPIFRCRKLPLPFKGRVGMGVQRQVSPPIPLLSSPLKGEGRNWRKISANRVVTWPSGVRLNLWLESVIYDIVTPKPN